MVIPRILNLDYSSSIGSLSNPGLLFGPMKFTLFQTTIVIFFVLSGFSQAHSDAIVGFFHIMQKIYICL